MALFDFLKSKRYEQKTFALQQQIASLKEEVSNEEKKKEGLQLQVQKLENQITELNNQVVVQRNELYDLQEAKENAKNQAKKATERYESLDKILKNSTRQVRSIPSSEYAPLVSLSDKYLISIDEDDFQELSKYYSLREENKTYYDKKDQREKELQIINDKVIEANNELARLREELVKQRDFNHVYEINMIKEQVGEYTQELQEIKTDINGYLKKHRDRIRIEVIHEIYQRANLCEDEALRHLRETIDGVNIGAIQLSLDLRKMLLKPPYKVNPQEWTVSEIYLGNLLNEFAQLNIVKIIREMKNSDWDTIKVKIGSLIEVLESRLIGTGSCIDSSYGKNLFNYLEAKYLHQ